MSEIKGYFTTSGPSEVISAMDSAKHKNKTDAKDDGAKQGDPKSRYGNEEDSHTSDREKQPHEATPNRDLVHCYARMRPVSLHAITSALNIYATTSQS